MTFTDTQFSSLFCSSQIFGSPNCNVTKFESLWFGAFSFWNKLYLIKSPRFKKKVGKIVNDSKGIKRKETH